MARKQLLQLLAQTGGQISDPWVTGQRVRYLVEAGGRAVFIETGTSLAVPGLLHVLEEKGIAREAVAYVIPTHVHLDHAGAAGQLMQQLPKAQLVVHPRGARHLIDPSKLIAGTMAVYGETKFKALYGELIPVPAQRVETPTFSRKSLGEEPPRNAKT